MTDIENTTTRDSAIHLMGSLSDGTDSYITGMEADGQHQLVASDKLPADADWPAFQALGFVKGEPVEGDPLFVRAALPEGWTRAASDHSMGSYLIDERGVKRVSIFYKAAFYDRRANMTLMRVGASVVTDVVYGDGPVVLPDAWPVLTAAERDEAAKSITYYLDQSKAHPDIYRGPAARAQQLQDLIAAAAE